MADSGDARQQATDGHVLEAALGKLKWNADHDEQTILTPSQCRALLAKVQELTDELDKAEARDTEDWLRVVDENDEASRRMQEAERASSVVRNYLLWQKAIHGGFQTEALHRQLIAEGRPKPSLDDALAVLGGDVRDDYHILDDGLGDDMVYGRRAGVQERPPCTCTIACIPGGKTDDQVCKLECQD